MITPLQAAVAEGIVDEINAVWFLLVSFLIFFMHAGFAMLEAGQVRSKNVANQLTKNLLTWSVGISVYFLVGAGVYAVAGGGEYVWTFAGSGLDWVTWLYGAVFAMTAATIVSGAVAGRAKLRAYVLYTVVLSAVIYPVVGGISWVSGSFLYSMGFQDFAGGMVVHGMGGIAGLTAAWVIGPRIGRFNDDGSVNVIPGHSMTFAVLGTLILAFGWYGFNVGTAAILSFSPDPGAASTVLEVGGETVGFNSDTLGRVAMTTTLAMGAGAMGAGLVAWLKTRKVDTLYVANGLLAGLVGITAIPDTTAWWGAFVVGGLAGAQLPVVFGFVERRLNVDDVCAVFPVHGSAGVLGTLMFPFVAAPGVVDSIPGAFLTQVVGVVVIGTWTVLATAGVFGALRALGQHRVSEDHEREGLDSSEHGVETYPEFGGRDSVMADGGATFNTTERVGESDD